MENIDVDNLKLVVDYRLFFNDTIYVTIKKDDEAIFIKWHIFNLANCIFRSAKIVSIRFNMS